MPPPAFLEELPPEIRVKIYGYIFGPIEVITPGGKSKPAPTGDHRLQPGGSDATTYTPASTEILATSKLIYKKASNVLYDGRIVRASIPELAILTHSTTFSDHVQKVEVVDCANGYKETAFIPVLMCLQQLPRMTSTAILSDDFALADGETSLGFLPVTKFAKIAGLGSLKCVDIGRYQLGGNLKYVEIVNRRLLTMWPGVVDTPKDYDVCSDVLALLAVNRTSVFVPEAATWAAHMSLRRWVGLYEEAHRQENFDHPDTNDEEAQKRAILLRHFMDSTRGWYPQSILDLSDNDNTFCPKFKTLSPGTNQAVLAWATEVLSMNIAAYYPHDDNIGQPTGFPSLCTLREAHWVETHGGAHTLEIMGPGATTDLSFAAAGVGALEEDMDSPVDRLVARLGD